MTVDKLPVLGETPGEPELTPAAEERLDQNVAVIRQQILRELSRHQPRGQEHIVRAADVEKATQHIFTDDITVRLSRIARAFLVLVASGAVLAFILLESISVKGSSSTAWLAIGTSVMIGITSGVAASLVVHEVRVRHRTSYKPIREFMLAFANLESEIRVKARELLDDGSDTASLGRVVSAMEILQLWTPEDSYEFRKLLSLRNSIVHEDSRTLPAEKIAQSFVEMTRLESLLNLNSARRAKSWGIAATNRKSSLAFEERLANALREASIHVEAAPAGAGYDLLAGNREEVKRIVTKYRQSGPLTVNDVSNIASAVNTPTVVVTNAPVSPYVQQILELAPQGREGSSVSVVQWQPGNPTDALVAAIESPSHPRGIVPK